MFIENSITYRENWVQCQVGDDIRPRSLPMHQDFLFFDRGIPTRPSEVGKERYHLVMPTKIPCYKLAKAQGKSERGYEQRHNTRIQITAGKSRLFNTTYSIIWHRQFRNSLFLQEVVQGFAVPHEDDVLSVDPDEEGATYTAESSKTQMQSLGQTYEGHVCVTYPIKAKTNSSCGSKGKSM